MVSAAAKNRRHLSRPGACASRWDANSTTGRRAHRHGARQLRGAPAPGVSGSIGEHVRHALDHSPPCWLRMATAPLSYDRRERGTAVESDTSAALRQILRLKAALERRSARSLDDPILVESLVSPAGAAVGRTSLARELAFVFSHTVHHLSTIALLMNLQDIGVPDRFGYAPSTPASRIVGRTDAMCTVTIVPLDDNGFRLVCNRDERRRADARPPDGGWSAAPWRLFR